MKVLRKRKIGLVLVVVAATVAALTLSSCGGATVVIKDLSLDPDTVTIKAGDSVTWKNEDRRVHQIMSGAPPVMTNDFVSPPLEKGDSWSHSFEEPGEYPYHSMTGAMLGRVIVEAR